MGGYITNPGHGFKAGCLVERNLLYLNDYLYLSPLTVRHASPAGLSPYQTWYGHSMSIDPEIGSDIEFDESQNEFTGSTRESLKAPEPHEPICLISYEITFILLAGGPDCRSGFWRSYRRELALNRRTDYQNYHVQVCSRHLVSLRMQLDRPVYFRNNRLTTEKQLDPFSTKALAASPFTLYP